MGAKSESPFRGVIANQGLGLASLLERKRHGCRSFLLVCKSGRLNFL